MTELDRVSRIRRQIFQPGVAMIRLVRGVSVGVVALGLGLGLVVGCGGSSAISSASSSKATDIKMGDGKMTPPTTK